MGAKADHSQEMTFWEHLDVLRDVLIKSLAALCVATILCFCFKETLFDAIMLPSSPDFWLFRWLGIAPRATTATPGTIINTELAGQLMVHFKMAMSTGLALSLPYCIWALGSFVSPALHKGEKKALNIVLLGGTLLFYAGMALSYLLVFPLSYTFLIDYSVGESVTNMISLTSYTDTLLVLCILMGLLFELPMVALALAKIGIVDAKMMSQYRRHAIVGIVALAAVVTPTTDVLSLALVSAPVYLLYEVSILIVRIVEKRKD